MGIVEEVGSAVTNLKPGDRVVGRTRPENPHRAARRSPRHVREVPEEAGRLHQGRPQAVVEGRNSTRNGRTDRI